MNSTLLRIYDKLILQRPVVTLLLTLAVIGFFVWQTPQFKLDASGDSLVLENDTDLHYHRRIAERYGTRDVLVLTYTAKGDLFSAPTLTHLKELRNELRQLEGVTSVTTILDVPLLLSTNVSLGDLSEIENIKTLEKSDVDKKEVLTEFRDNPLYSGRLLSRDEKTTAILINLPIDKTYKDLLKRRYELREKKYKNELSPEEGNELQEVSQQYRQQLTKLQHEFGGHLT